MYNAGASTQPEVKAAEEPKKGALAALALHGVGPQQLQSEEAGRAEELAHIWGRALFSATGPIKRTLQAQAESGHDHEHKETSHAWIGVALILGFILMYLIDALQSSSPPRGHHIPLTQLDSPDRPDPFGETKVHSKSITIGLVIHACADGIALGASSADSTTQSTLGLIVFVAILVHKAPAAFGLTSVLLKQGLGKRAARAHLLVFCLAAPLGACVTWALINLGSPSSASAAASGDSTWWTGLVLVFSGGTFL
jgi:zinc transporter 9